MTRLVAVLILELLLGVALLALGIAGIMVNNKWLWVLVGVGVGLLILASLTGQRIHERRRRS